MNNTEFVDKLVSINRITKVVKGGRRFAFSALVVVGNQSGSIGFGHGKAKQIPDAIKKAKESKISDDFLIIARIESFILGKNIDDAIKRAESYSRAGADAILIHSKEKNANQIFSNIFEGPAGDQIFSNENFLQPGTNIFRN